jgi:hypothetical protein
MKTACGNENIQDVLNVNFLRNQQNVQYHVTGACDTCKIRQLTTLKMLMFPVLPFPQGEAFFQSSNSHNFYFVQGD